MNNLALPIVEQHYMTLINHLLVAALLVFGHCKSQQQIVQEQPAHATAVPSHDKAEPIRTNTETLRTYHRTDLISSDLIRRALLRAKPHDTIEIPSGQYLIEEPIDIKTDHLTIVCQNCELISNSRQNIIIAKEIQHLTLMGIKGTSRVPSNANLVRMSGGSNLSLLDCHTYNLGLLFLEKGEKGEVHRGLFVDNCSASEAGGDGIKLQSLEGFTIVNSKFINCTRDGIKTNLAPCNNGLIRNCYFESNGDDAFDLFGGGSNIKIDSSTFVESKIQLKNMGGKDYRGYIKNCTVKHNTFQDATIICLSKFLPESEFQGLQGIVVDSNKWVNEQSVCFMTNGAVNYQFTNNDLFIKSGQTAINVRPPLGEGLIQHNTIKSGITYLDTNPKKGVYLLHTKAQSDPRFGARDDQGTLRIENNTFINGRRDLVLEGLANYTLINNVSIAQNDKSIYLGRRKNAENDGERTFQRTVANNKILREPPTRE